jgi:hypothetical protein
VPTPRYPALYQINPQVRLAVRARLLLLGVAYVRLQGAHERLPGRTKTDRYHAPVLAGSRSPPPS